MKKAKNRKPQFFLLSFLLIILGIYTSFSVSQIKAEKNDVKDEKKVKPVVDEGWLPVANYEFSKVRLGVDQFLAFSFGGKQDSVLKNPAIDFRNFTNEELSILATPTFYYLNSDKIVSTTFDLWDVETDIEMGRPWTSSGLMIMGEDSTVGKLGYFGDDAEFKSFKQYRKAGDKGSSLLKTVFEIEASSPVPYHLLVTQTMEYVSASNLVLVNYEYQNLSNETLTDYAFGSIIDTLLGEDDDVNIYYLGKKRGLYIENEGYRLDYHFDVPNGMANWSGGNYAGGTLFDRTFYSVDAVGQEQLGEDVAAAGMLSAKVDDSGMVFKTQPVTLKPGESTNAAYGVSVSAVELIPEMTLDNKDGTYYGGNVSISGTWKDIDSDSGDLYAIINGREPIKINPKALPNNPKNVVHNWSLEIPEAQMSTTEENRIIIYIVDSDNNRSKEETFTLKYNRKPILNLVETTGDIKGTDSFKGTLKWSDEDTDELSIYYSVNGGTKQLLSKVTNTDKGVEQSLAYEIPSSALQGTKQNYKVEFWIEDNDKKSDIKELNLTKNNQPVIQTDFSVEKTEIFETESNSYKATIKNTADEPSDWDNVVYETVAFPENVVVDKKTVKLNGVVIPEGSITFGIDKKLKIELGKIAPKTEVILTYTVNTIEAEPPITEIVTVTQSYNVKGTSMAKPIEKESSTQAFTIKPQEPEISIQFLEEKTNGKLPLESITKKGKMREKLDIPLENIKGYEFSKVVVDGVERSLVGDVLTVEFGKDKEVIFYYFGTLKIQSSPSLFDFGVQTANIKGMKLAKPDISGSPLIITDTRSTKQKWNLKAKISEPLKSLEDEKIIMTDVIKYKNSTEEVTLTNSDSVIFTPENTNSGEYNLTEDYWSKGEGFLMDFPAGSIKALGKYNAQITITLENAK
ncbi:hypothetical protein ACWOC1_01410 [Enterococcus quebecensis]|uniref:Uncharacterized protein n=1 Tax=Enterococcus quebecensis TaxID=903983 RepID=A0A1E5H3D6_9ENTE|nr:hypothetical protein [Enterococcus quebecensis]OEG19517.1 hypothetical protein BCR23_02170 [Enterococcus quebecensis]OJG75205.1 hypothetical protein RV12_GL001810 [Enterococcus quebecensis]